MSVHPAYIPVKKIPGQPGKYFNRYMYVLIQVKRGWFVLEHRYVVENVLGRKLAHNEEVHHINGVKYDNRPSNLIVCSNSYHELIHKRCYRKYGRWHPPVYDDPNRLNQDAFAAGIPITPDRALDTVARKTNGKSQPRCTPEEAVTTVRRLLGLW